MLLHKSINMQPEILSKPDNKTTNIYVKNCRFKHTCNDDADIGRRKQQKLEVRGRARREAARRRKSKWKVNLGNRNSSRSNVS